MNAIARIAHRDFQPELMDRPELESSSHFAALQGLARLNRWSHTASTIWRPLEQLARGCRRPLRVLDIATGGGDVLCDLAGRAKRANIPFEFGGCDISARAIEFARQRADRQDLSINLFSCDVLQDSLPDEFDVIISSLFLHHLTEEQAIVLLDKAKANSREMIVISDLRRTVIGWWLASVATRLLTRSPVVHFDGPRSVGNAYTCSEIRSIVERAGLSNAEITNCWPQRYLMCWRRN